MNKQFNIITRLLKWLYIAFYVFYILFVGYQLLVMRQTSPDSTIPVLSTAILQANEKALEGRFVLPVDSQYTASTSGAFGKSEPFNP